MSRAAHQSRRVKTGAVWPAQRGATRSLTAPTPRTRKTAVSPPSQLKHTQTHTAVALWRVVLLCFVFRPHRLLSLLQAGSERKRFHQLQLHLAVHPRLVDLRWRQWLRRLRWRDQLPGWAQARTKTHILPLRSQADRGSRHQLEKT